MANAEQIIPPTALPTPVPLLPLCAAPMIDKTNPPILTANDKKNIIPNTIKIGSLLLSPTVPAIKKHITIPTNAPSPRNKPIVENTFFSLCNNSLISSSV